MQKRPSLVVLSAIGRFFMVALALLALTGNASAASAGRIYCQGTELMADGSRIYLNGANTPWNQWNEFGGAYDSAWWSAEFARLKAKGINSTRIWICCDGLTHPSIDANGYVTGVSATFWSNVDNLMSLAQANQIYVMATMMSFDFANPYIWDYGTNAHSTKYLAWTSMLKSSVKVQTMIDNFIVPFAVRYKDNPFLYAIDLCNEPEWINQNAGGGSAWVVVSWAELQRYVAMSAVAIHNSGSSVLVTLGSAGAKWNSVIYENNYWSDALLQAQVVNDKVKARLDFYQLHYYYWMQPYYPLRKSAVELQLADRPLVMGELPGKPIADNGDRLLPVGETMALISEYFFNNGYSGHYPWTSNLTGSGNTGSLTDFGAAALAFQQAHPTVIRFVGTGTAQTITFPVIPTQSYAGSNVIVALGATASSSLAVAYSVTSGPATVSGSTLTITGSGSVVVAANQGGNVTYQAAATVSRTVTVSDARATQTITFPAIAAQTWAGTNLTVPLGATASSGLVVAYTVTSGPATVSGSTLTITGSGSVVVAANQAGNGAYLPASQVSRTIAVSKTAQTITFPAIAAQSFAGTNVTVALGATASSGLAVVYTVSSGPATVSGSTLTITGSGSVVVAANQAGNSTYSAAATVSGTVTVTDSRSAQTITFPTVAAQIWTGSNVTVTLGATASSGLAVVYTVTSGPATVSGSTLTITGVGSVVVVANQAGNSLFLAASPVSQAVAVADTRTAQTITFPAIAAQTWAGTNLTVTLSATASSGLAVVYTVTSGSATVSGSTLTITGAGSVVVAANQAGNSTYQVAVAVSRTVTVTKTAQTITFPAIASQTWAGSNLSVALSATASSGLSVVYSVTSGSATVSGSTLTITGAGSVVVAANQAGNSIFQTATPASQSAAVADGQGSAASTGSSSKGCGLGGTSAMLLLVMLGLFQRLLVAHRLGGRSP